MYGCLPATMCPKMNKSLSDVLRVFNGSGFFVVFAFFVLFCFVLFCFVLFCFVLFCFVLFCFLLFCFVLFCFVFFCFVLFCFCRGAIIAANLDQRGPL